MDLFFHYLWWFCLLFGPGVFGFCLVQVFGTKDAWEAVGLVVLSVVFGAIAEFLAVGIGVWVLEWAGYHPYLPELHNWLIKAALATLLGAVLLCVIVFPQWSKEVQERKEHSATRDALDKLGRIVDQHGVSSEILSQAFTEEARKKMEQHKEEKSS